MALHVEMLLPLQPPSTVEAVRKRLEAVPAPAGQVWTISVQDLPADDGWLIVARGAVELADTRPEWSVVTVEGGEATLRSVYSRVAWGLDREPALLARSLERLFGTPLVRTAFRQRPVLRRPNRGRLAAAERTDVGGS